MEDAVKVAIKAGRAETNVSTGVKGSQVFR
jgi:hypothetical protein